MKIPEHDPSEIVVDHSGNVWISLVNDGIIRVDGETHKVERLSWHSGGFRLPRMNYLGFFVEESDRVWVCGGREVLCIDWRNKSVTVKAGGTGTSSCIVKDSSGRLWIGTWRKGAMVQDRETGDWILASHREDARHSLSSNMIRSAFVDRTGNVWFGTDRGVSVHPRYKKNFVHYEGRTSDSTALYPGQVSSIAEDPNGRLWVGVFGSGMSLLDRRTGSFRNYAVSSPYMRYLFTSEDGRFIVSAFEPKAYDPKTDRFMVYPLEKLGIFPPATVVWDRFGTTWYGFHNGLVRVSRDGTRRVIAGKGDRGLDGINVSKIVEDRSGTIWLSTFDRGLLKYDAHRDTFTTTSVLPVVYDIVEDAVGELWLGTDRGLLKYDRVHDSITVRISRENGLGGDRVYGMIEDQEKNLWLSLDESISRVHTGSLQIRTYGSADGVPPASITTETNYGNAQHVRTSRGEFVIGRGSAGFVIFRPEEIVDNPVIPPVYVTGFSLAHQSRDSEQDPVSSRNIVLADTIVLRHDENDFSFKFAALNYSSPEQNQYKYRLEGLEDEWVEAGTRNQAFYTNVGPGEYRFHVLGSNNDGVWNQIGASVQVIITPPWWATPWAYMGYGVIALSLLGVIRRYELNRQSLKLEARAKSMEAHRLRDLDQLKTRFYTNISHEFRTPLTLIEGPVRQLQSGDFPGDVSEVYAMILRNTRRLLTFVNQLLDLSRIESGQRHLRVERFDIAETIRTLSASFESLASAKDIRYELHARPESLSGWADVQALELIVINLLSNAFKFTQGGGRVTVGVEADPTAEHAVLTVSDTGKGIPSNQLNRIFDRFYQVDDTHTRAHEGTGIGLALTKELVELHHGSIGVESEEGVGSMFTVRLPVARGRYSSDEISEGAATPIVPRLESQEFTGPLVHTRQEHDESKPLILIVEDNADMRRYIRSYLENNHRIEEAPDGGSGFELASQKIPDLIISDVMMPAMDGFEFCRRVKADERTSHIPFILLTAKAEDTHKLEGLDTGADEYLVKPFDARELITRVRNLISQREKLRERYRRELVVKPADIQVSSADERFLKKVLSAVEANISNPDYSVESLARETALSRMQLHRKLKALVGYSPGDLIRHFRLQRAAELLKKRAGTVSEIAYDVGFNNLSHFSARFKEQFGVNPSDY